MFRLRLAVGVLVILCSAPSFAQDQPNPDDLNKKYQDALAQLKAAQDRKNELANENEQLKARLAELEKQHEECKRTVAGHAEQTFFYRSHYAAWQSFIRRYPRLMLQWEAFLESDILSPIGAVDPTDPASLLMPDRWQKSSEAK